LYKFNNNKNNEILHNEKQKNNGQKPINDDAKPINGKPMINNWNKIMEK
jgi:hypothetical protein